jgi:CubicO group peptidase (beta-lactamase class C family)
MSKFRAVLLSASIAFVAHSASAQETAKAPVISTVSDEMRRLVDAHEIAGAVTLVASPDRTLHLDATGLADIAKNTPMRPDTIFWIASMTKPVTATAILMLQDQGKLSVDDLVEKHLPEFRDLKTASGEPARLTIRHLLTHTSGMSELSGTETRGKKTLAELIPLFVKKPVQFTPGSKWAYCQSAINTAGRIVEVVSVETLPDFFENRLFAPLGMKDTTFYLTEAQLPRYATSYQRTAEGELKEAANFFLEGRKATAADRIPMANGGLFSTATDYARFCQMILRGGELDGKRYVKPESVKRMTSLQTADLKTGFTPGCGWGLGWCVVREPQGITAMLSPGTFGHGGAYGTQAWIDPEKGRAYILMVQRANFPNSDASDVRKGFQQAAATALKGQTP